MRLFTTLFLLLQLSVIFFRAKMNAKNFFIFTPNDGMSFNLEDILYKFWFPYGRHITFSTPLKRAEMPLYKLHNMLRFRYKKYNKKVKKSVRVYSGMFGYFRVSSRIFGNHCVSNGKSKNNPIHVSFIREGILRLIQ